MLTIRQGTIPDAVATGTCGAEELLPVFSPDYVWRGRPIAKATVSMPASRLRSSFPPDVRGAARAPAVVQAHRAPARAAGIAALLLATTLAAQVPAGGAYSLPRHVIGAGGARAAGGGYTIVGTMGQTATGPASAAGYTVQQGFHAAAADGSQPDPMFRNGFE